MKNLHSTFCADAPFPVGSIPWLLSWVFKLYIATLPLVAAFAFTPILPLPLIAGIIMAVLFFLNVRTSIRFDLFDLLFVALFFVVLLPWAWGLPYISSKSITYISALVVTFVVYYFVPRQILISQFSKQNGFENFCCLYSAMLFLLSIFLIFEFVGNNILGVRMDNIIPTPARQEYMASITRGIHRSRGLAAESAHTAILFNLGLFLSIIGVRSQLKRWIFWPVVLLGYITLFSVASFVLVGVATSYYIIRSLISRGIVVWRPIVFGAIIAFLGVLFFKAGLEEYFYKSFQPKILGLFGVGSYGSGLDRLDIYKDSLLLVTEYPFGIGFGIAASAAEHGDYFGLSVTAGQVSTLGLFLVAGGILGAFCFLVISFGFVVRSMRLNNYSEAVSAGGIAISAQYLLIGDFYMPYLWLFWAIVVALSANRRQFSKAALETP